jgi:hypothetical protein
MLHAFAATRDPLYADRAQRIIQTFRSDLSATVPTWPYYWSRSKPYTGYTAQEKVSMFSPRMSPNRAAEDTTHGALDIETAVLGNRLGLGPSAMEMKRLAASFLLRAIAPSRPHPSASAGGPPSNVLAIPRWVGLSHWNRGVYAQALHTFNQLQPQPNHAQVLASIGALVLYRE